MQHNLTRPQSSVTEQARTILIVEDDLGVGTFLAAAITQETPHHAALVTDGFQALAACAASHVDLLLLDYSLPQMNGIELYDKLQEQYGTKTPPTVMISARLPVNELVRRNLPSLRKPLELQSLLDTIERLLQ